MNHQFNTKIAEKYGIEEAILIEHLYFWIHKNRCLDEMVHHDRTWCYSSAKGFNKYVTYMSTQKIRRVLVGLEKRGFIYIDNFNKTAFNQTLWYAFTDSAIEELEELGYDILKSKTANFNNEKCEDNNNENKENKEEKNNINNNIYIGKKAENEEEKRFAEYMMKNFPHVCNMSSPMTLAEYKKLLDMHYSPQQIEDKLYVLENKKEYTKKYRSPYLCVRNWLKADNPRV